MCILGLLGIILMIIDNEITFLHIDHHDTIFNWFVKLTITISTILLIGLVLYYHYYDINLYCANNSIEHWGVGLTGRRIALILLEIVICAIHPIPRHFPLERYSKNDQINANSTIFYHSKPTPISLTYVPVDVALGLPSKFIVFILKKTEKVKQ